MQHPDENLLTEWSDGELDASTTAELEAHLTLCASCHARARALRTMATEVEALLSELETPEPKSAEGQDALPADHGSPVVLLPYNEMPTWRRSRWRRTLGIAATIVVAGGAGWMALRPGASQAPDTSSGELAVEAGYSAAGASIDSLPRPADLARVETTASDSPARAREAGADTGADSAPLVLAQTGSPEPAPAEPPSFGQPTVIPVLPRPNRVQARSVADYSAALSSAEPQRVTELKSTSQREPLDIARDAQLSSRIGLDEARQQLGSNLHVIEGLRPEMVGLVPGRLVAGADASRPVVRVVYLGDDGQSFFLDQQRVSTGLPSRRAATARQSGSWLDGNVQLRLHGELSPDSLERLARRVK